MAYKKGENRRQRVLFPECIDEYVGQDAPVRFFDAFVDSLDMEKLGFIRSTPAETGTPGYDPRDLMKLYIYGYFYAVRSSRKLARECRCNIEVMWLLCKLAPDFRTISDFRKDNRKAIEKTFKEFNRFCHKLKLFSKSFISIDGSKFKAVNAKDSNFTLNKLDDRIARLDEHIKLYMEELDECDCDEGRKLSKDELEQKIDACQQRKGKYEAYRDALESSGQSQISVTDPDAKLMKSNEGFCVGYNPQVAVDAESHLIAGYMMTNCPMGQTLRQKSIKRNGFIRYCNRLACARCMNKCTKSSNKEVDFSKDSLMIRVKGNKYSEAAGANSENRKTNRRSTTSKVVSYVLHLNKSMMDQRKNLSEHPFGTIKRHLGQYYFLLKGFEKVSAEMSMFCLSYNLKRVLNMRSVNYLINAL
ncbi:MAG: transposase [Bacteroidales bacterium]|nr:transposase [Bacteroidales bacterium]